LDFSDLWASLISISQFGRPTELDANPSASSKLGKVARAATRPYRPFAKLQTSAKFDACLNQAWFNQPTKDLEQDF
jgi:hypothetical protein